MLGELRQAPSAVIANAASLSGAINLGDGGLVALKMPSAWTAAALTFKAAEKEDGTYYDVYDSTGTALSVTAAASTYILLAPSTFAGLRFIKIQSGTTGSPVAQGAARTIIVLVRKLA